MLVALNWPPGALRTGTLNEAGTFPESSANPKSVSGRLATGREGRFII